MRLYMKVIVSIGIGVFLWLYYVFSSLKVYVIVLDAKDARHEELLI